MQRVPDCGEAPQAAREGACAPQIICEICGLKAGTAASGEPLGEANRLEASYRQLMHVKGHAASGPVETETEVTEGQLFASQVSIQELHANYAAVTEEAIENEAIPLSHRQHVKRYFQAIRPKE